MDTFVGKFLVRKARMKNGKPAFILCGVAVPENFDIDSINDNDEMWVARLGVAGSKKYELKEKGATGYHGSPEDFIEMMPDLKSEFCEWKEKVA